MKKPLLNSALAVCTAVAGWMPCWRWLEECAWFLGPLNVKCRSNLLQLINLQTTTSNQFYRDSAVSSQVADTHWALDVSSVYLVSISFLQIQDSKSADHNNDNVIHGAITHVKLVMFYLCHYKYGNTHDTFNGQIQWIKNLIFLGPNFWLDHDHCWWKSLIGCHSAVVVVVVVINY